jgi:TRAP-type C4-dicarboxylate transport system permease small subunit
MPTRALVVWIERVFRGIVAACLFAMMGLTFVDVLARKLLGTSVPGGVELIELFMLGVIFAGLPLVSLAGEHIVLDMLDTLLSAAFTRLQARLSHAVCTLALAGAGGLVLERAQRTMAFGDVTPALAIGVGKFQVLIALSLFVTAAVHLLLILDSAKAPTSRAQGNAP